MIEPARNNKNAKDASANPLNAISPYIVFAIFNTPKPIEEIDPLKILVALLEIVPIKPTTDDIDREETLTIKALDAIEPAMDSKNTLTVSIVPVKEIDEDSTFCARREMTPLNSNDATSVLFDCFAISPAIDIDATSILVSIFCNVPCEDTDATMVVTISLTTEPADTIVADIDLMVALTFAPASEISPLSVRNLAFTASIIPSGEIPACNVFVVVRIASALDAIADEIIFTTSRKILPPEEMLPDKDSRTALIVEIAPLKEMDEEIALTANNRDTAADVTEPTKNLDDDKALIPPDAIVPLRDLTKDLIYEFVPLKAMDDSAEMETYRRAALLDAIEEEITL